MTIGGGGGGSSHTEISDQFNDFLTFRFVLRSICNFHFHL